MGTFAWRKAVLTGLALSALALLAVAVHATMVTPADTVVNYVVVRKTPSAQSTPVGKLNPGDQAEELESIKHWFKVQLADGTIGYVNKAWVNETEAASPTPTPAVGGGGAGPTPTDTPALTGGGAAPVPLLAAGHPVTWWFVFKFNGTDFQKCDTGDTRHCSFGGTVQTGSNYTTFGQQFVFASSESPTLQKGAGCVGDTDTDPVGATFGQIYNGTFHYVVWNDQFYGDPDLAGCPQIHPPSPPYCAAPWGHSKGMVAWNDAGEGVVLQVTTPSWPAAGSAAAPRQTDGNSLGCIKDNDVKLSQHFFALQLTHDDLLKVLAALQNASVATDPANPQLVNNGGPADVQALVAGLGVQSASIVPTSVGLSTGVELISKASHLNVPPWQMVSAILGSTPLRAATFWGTSDIPSTAGTTPGCWSPTLSTPGAVEIATSGQWNGQSFSLQSDRNHAKIGVSTSASAHYAIFGDMNQAGALSGTPSQCAASQNGRGGLFFVIDNATLASSVSDLVQGGTAPP